MASSRAVAASPRQLTWIPSMEHVGEPGLGFHATSTRLRLVPGSSRMGCRRRTSSSRLDQASTPCSRTSTERLNALLESSTRYLFANNTQRSISALEEPCASFLLAGAESARQVGWGRPNKRQTTAIHRRAAPFSFEPCGLRVRPRLRLMGEGECFSSR